MVKSKRKRPPEVVTVSSELDVISVRGGQTGSLLSIAGEPVLVDSSDYSGSLGWLAERYLAPPVAGDLHLLTEWVDEAQWQRLRAWLADPTPVERLADPLAPLLEILEDGKYTLRLTPVSDIRIVAVDCAKPVGWYRGGFEQPEDVEVIPTHWWPPPDAERIEHYRRQLIAAGRPAAVLLAHSAGAIWYLLDGHHKVAAYQMRGLDPVCVTIERQPPHRIRPRAMPHSWPDNRPIWES
ncbi:hypothetical protein OH799_00610 [Nocardia sp. NBC_00881]|uniref:hypothetical protein n=1 Tax=Nocardia sp. NBC_00881 TaxID=2975995 RepID=UPI00386C83AF|nr:hypothetical protein OH799_00610 [Nocardia sp. NBC_00881]